MKDKPHQQHTTTRGANYLAIALVIIGGLAALITQVDTITTFLQPSIEGAWCLDVTVQQSTVDSFKGLQLTYHVFFEKHGADIAGKGEKEMENGVLLPRKARSPIFITGIMKGSEIIARYDLKPAIDQAARSTTGEFRWTTSADHYIRGHVTKLEGTFSGTGGSSGVVIGLPITTHICKRSPNRDLLK